MKTGAERIGVSCIIYEIPKLANICGPPGKSFSNHKILDFCVVLPRCGFGEKVGNYFLLFIYLSIYFISGAFRCHSAVITPCGRVARDATRPTASPDNAERLSGDRRPPAGGRRSPSGSRRTLPMPKGRRTSRLNGSAKSHGLRPPSGGRYNTFL